jgi:hypothetical protein
VVCNSRSKNERCRQDFNVKDIANPRVLALARRDFFALALVIIKAMGNAAVKRAALTTNDRVWTPRRKTSRPRCCLEACAGFRPASVWFGVYPWAGHYTNS